MSTLKFQMVPANGGSVQKVVGCTHHTLIETAATGGVFTALLAEVPVDCGPPMHYHENDAEWAYVLQGQITFSTPDGAVIAGPGDSVFLPAGRGHSFRNSGTESARMLVISTPGAQLSGFFEEVDATLHGALVPPVMVEIASRYGINFGPPPAADCKAA